MVNAVGLPQHSVVSLELTLDETSMLYKVEEVYRDIISVMGVATSGIQGIRGWL